MALERQRAGAEIPLPGNAINPERKRCLAKPKTDREGLRRASGSSNSSAAAVTDSLGVEANASAVVENVWRRRISRRRQTSMTPTIDCD